MLVDPSGMAQEEALRNKNVLEWAVAILAVMFFVVIISGGKQVPKPRDIAAGALADAAGVISETVVWAAVSLIEFIAGSGARAADAEIKKAIDENRYGDVYFLARLAYNEDYVMLMSGALSMDMAMRFAKNNGESIFANSRSAAEKLAQALAKESGVANGYSLHPAHPGRLFSYPHYHVNRYPEVHIWYLPF